MGATLAVVLAACGGGSTPTDSATPSASASVSASPSAGSATRPEGPWTLVAWSMKRSDLKVEQRLARVILATMSSDCPSGPCELTLTPAGSDGSFREPEAPRQAGATPTTAPLVLAWDGTTYSGGVKARVGSCTTAKGEVVADGYSTTTTMSFTFVPAAGKTPARVHGTVTHDAKGTAKSRPKGCTDFLETESLGGVPTGSLDPKTAPSGEFEGTMVTTAATPKKLAAVGSELWLGTMTGAGDATAPTITGLTDATGPLTAGADGWGAALPAAPTSCVAPDGSQVAKGADGTESFTGLHPVALTKDGKPIFAGSWRLRANPNATGLKSSCGLAVYEGRIYLVPRGAG